VQAAVTTKLGDPRSVAIEALGRCEWHPDRRSGENDDRRPGTRIAISQPLASPWAKGGRQPRSVEETDERVHRDDEERQEGQILRIEERVSEDDG
jgi:hypothetical protein